MKIQRTDAQVKAFAKFKKHSKEVQEDFAQYVNLKSLEGRESKLEFLLIDFLREEFGRSDESIKFSNPYEYNDELHGTIHMDKHNLDFKLLVGALEGKERAYITMIHLYGLSHREVSEAFGLTEGRISQEVKAIYEKLRRAVVNPRRYYAPVEGNV